MQPLPDILYEACYQYVVVLLHQQQPRHTYILTSE
jgi:hypothetical protein